MAVGRFLSTPLGRPSVSHSQRCRLIGPEQHPYGGRAAVAPDTRPALWCRTSLLYVSNNKKHDTSMSCEDRSLAPYMEVAYQSSLMVRVQLPDGNIQFISS